MKRLLMFLLVATSALAQSVTITNNNGMYTLTNTGTKNVVLVAGNLSFNGGKIVMPFAHEFLWKQALLVAADTQQTPAFDDKASPTTTFVQYDDGTTWGDANSLGAQDALARRKETLAYLPTLANASTLDDFLAALKQPQTARGVMIMQKTVQMEVKNAGAQTAWGHAKDRWAAAQSRSSLWNF